MSIIIGADLVPTESNYDLFETADLNALFGDELLRIINDADYKIFNLETPITDTLAPIKKCGPALSTPTRTMAGIKALGIDLFTIANNHIMDQGYQGLYSTIENLTKAGITTVGCGNNLLEACKPHRFDFNGKIVGVYACAEHEFSIATDNAPGANPFDPLESFDHIVNLKSSCDYVIVLYHGGKEHYRYPSPRLQKVCRKFIDKGADIVICQHSHCIGCEEKYQSGTIVYGQGNFLFDYSKSDFWQTSLLISINDDFSISYIPLIKQDNVVRLARENNMTNIFNAFYERSRSVYSSEFVKSRYSEYATENIHSLMRSIAGKRVSFFYKLINKLTKNKYEQSLIRKKYKVEKIAVKNYFQCESLNELIEFGIDVI